MVGRGALGDLIEEILRIDILQDFPDDGAIRQLLGRPDSLAQGETVNPFQQGLGDGMLRSHGRRCWLQSGAINWAGNTAVVANSSNGWVELPAIVFGSGPGGANCDPSARLNLNLDGGG